ncbi:hypothetical protein Bca4012_009301 [Brassica carinata]
MFQQSGLLPGRTMVGDGAVGWLKGFSKRKLRGRRDLEVVVSVEERKNEREDGISICALLTLRLQIQSLQILSLPEKQFHSLQIISLQEIQRWRVTNRDGGAPEETEEKADGGGPSFSLQRLRSRSPTLPLLTSP